MNLIKEIIIINPPHKHSLVYKREKFDAKGNLTKSLDGPCYGMDLMKTLDGAVLYKSSLQDTIKSQQQKNIDKIKKYEAFRKSPEFAKKLKEMENNVKLFFKATIHNTIYVKVTDSIMDALFNILYVYTTSSIEGR